MERPVKLIRKRRSTCGATLLEITIVLAILAVSGGAFAGMFLAGAKQQTIARDRAVAADAARNLLETMHGEAFEDLFHRYNSDPTDDPGGEGSAPGNRFLVEELRLPADSEDGMNGEVFFPSVDVEGCIQLREDVESDKLGMPRDLNGDSIINDEDHSAAYILLPVRIRVEWGEGTAASAFELNTMLSEFR